MCANIFINKYPFFGSINRFSSIGKNCKFEGQDSYVDLVYQATK
jgi:hypothetical protein